MVGKIAVFFAMSVFVSFHYSLFFDGELLDGGECASLVELHDDFGKLVDGRSEAHSVVFPIMYRIVYLHEDITENVHVL